MAFVVLDVSPSTVIYQLVVWVLPVVVIYSTFAMAHSLDVCVIVIEVVVIIVAFPEPLPRVIVPVPPCSVPVNPDGINEEPVGPVFPVGPVNVEAAPVEPVKPVGPTERRVILTVLPALTIEVPVGSVIKFI